MLAKLNQIEKFVRGRDQAYRAQLDIFRYAVEDVRKEAEAKNIDGVTLAFNQMTLSCVNCHKLLRYEILKRATPK
jgi:cytochrome c556